MEINFDGRGGLDWIGLVQSAIAAFSVWLAYISVRTSARERLDRRVEANLQAATVLVTVLDDAAVALTTIRAPMMSGMQRSERLRTIKARLHAVAPERLVAAAAVRAFLDIRRLLDELAPAGMDVGFKAVETKELADAIEALRSAMDELSPERTLALERRRRISLWPGGGGPRGHR